MHSSLLKSTAVFLLASGLAVADQPFHHDVEAINRGDFGRFPTQTFHSSNVVAPLFQVNHFDPDLVDSSGYIFLSLEADGKGGPAIFSSKDLSLVYANTNFSRTFDVRSQEKSALKYLTFIEGGYCHILDSTYHKRWSITAERLGGNTDADIHECQFTGQGTAIISAYQDIKYNMTTIGGAVDGLLADAVFQEVVIDSNRVTNVWRASNHFPLTDTYIDYDPSITFMEGGGFDWFHIDSIFKVSQPMDGEFLANYV